MFYAAPAYASVPQRIVSLKPNITEILFALGAGDRVVGVTKYCDYPEGAKELPSVADYVKPFAERIIDAAPDLIVGSQENSSRKSIHMLRRMGYDVALYPFSTVDDALGSIEAIAARIGLPRDGARLRRRIERGLEKARSARGEGAGRRVLVVWGQRPLVVTGPRTFMGELIDTVGAVNVVPVSKVRYPHWSAENVIAANPEVIVDMSHSASSGQAMGGGKEMWRRLTMIDAVKHGRVYTLDDSLFRAGPRLPLALKELSKAIRNR